MGRRKKSESQQEANKKGKERIKEFEERKSDIITIPKIDDNDDENSIMVCYEKKDGGEWEKIEVPYKRKKRL